MCLMQGILMRNRILPGVACIFFAQLAVANESLGLPFSQSDDIPMVLSATRLQQSFFDVPAAVTIIDRQMIEQSGVREIPELLRMVPGMVVGYDSSSSHVVSCCVSYHTTMLYHLMHTMSWSHTHGIIVLSTLSYLYYI